MIRLILLRVLLIMTGCLAIVVGVVMALFPRPLADLLGLPPVNVILLGLVGVMLIILGVGTLIANRDPIRHILWLRLLVLLLVALAGYGWLVFLGGGISRDGALAVTAITVVPALLVLILSPAAPRFVSTRVRSPDGMLYTDADNGGLFVHQTGNTFNPYVIRLAREPAMPVTTHRRHPRTAENPTRVMIVGGGAREHAIAVKLRESDTLEALFAAPGNGGTTLIAENLPIAASDVDAIVEAARQRDIELVIIGPEDPLARGLSDALRNEGILCLGPSREAAQLEWSKAFAKQVMDDAGVPTAEWSQFTDYSLAAEFVRTHPLPLVIKADGLAAGKGVAVCSTEEEALSFLHHIMRLGDFGGAGNTVIIEECLTGVELSVFALCDGEQMLMLPPASDYKRIHDGDEGPNTGGMGSYSPPEFVTDKLLADIRDTVFRPVLHRMVELEAPYNGILYAGLMLTDDGPKVIEFNSRMGDPEAQVVIPRITSDFLQLAAATARGKLDEAALSWTDRPAVGVVVASEGYPGDYPVGREISANGIPDAGVRIFHAGTTREKESGKLFTSGGRVLTVTALGDTMEEARSKAYANIERASFEGAQYRTDIAQRAVDAEK